MKKILIMLLFCAPVFALPFKQDMIFTVYDKLLNSNKEVKPLTLYVQSKVEFWCTLACTDRHTKIIVSTKVLRYVHNEAELASIVGHEMAHARVKSELKADVLGLEYVEKAGYNRCLAAQFLKGYIEDDNHPSGAERYKNTGCP